MVRRRKHGESNCIFRQTDRQTDVQRTAPYYTLLGMKTLIFC